MLTAPVESRNPGNQIYIYIQNQNTNKEINHIMSEYIKNPTTQSINQSINQTINDQ